MSRQRSFEPKVLLRGEGSGGAVSVVAGFERYFQRMAAREAGVEPPPEALEPWPEVIKVGPRIGEEED